MTSILGIRLRHNDVMVKERKILGKKSSWRTQIKINNQKRQEIERSNNKIAMWRTHVWLKFV